MTQFFQIISPSFLVSPPRYCHGKKPVSLYSATNALLFMFRTDCCFEGKGFRATFTVVDEGTFVCVTDKTY